MRKTIAAVALLLSSVVGTQTAQAVFVPTLTGSSAFAGSRTGFVNYAVYDNPTGSNWIADLGLGVTSIPGLVVLPAIPGNPPVTGLEENVFFFQIARTDTGDIDPIVTFTAPHGFDGFQTMGSVDGFVFTDAGGAVVGSDIGGNNSLDAGGITGFAAEGAAIDPVTTLGAVDNGGGGADAFFTGPAILGGDHSSVFFFTSNSRPLNPATPGHSTFDSLAFQDGAITGGITMLVPAPNPEPGSLALLALGLVGGGFWRRRSQETESNQASA